MELFVLWIVFALLVGWFWAKKGLSFTSGLIWSLILSPLIGFIIGLLKNPSKDKQKEAVSTVKVIVYIISAILIFFGLLFLMSARAEYTTSPGGRIITGLVLIGVGVFAAVMIRRSEPKQKIEITQKIDLSGSVRPEEMKCQQCGAPLDRNSVAVKEGAVFINCQYCKGTYQITEEPKW